MTKLSDKDKFVNSEFIDFIKSKELYSNIDNKIQEEYNLSLDKYLDRVSSGDIDILSGAFRWYHSEEGHKFWDEFNSEWFDIIDNKLNKISL